MNPMEKTELELLRALSRKKDSDLTQPQRQRLAYLSIRLKMDSRNRWGPIWDYLTFLFYKADIEGLCGSVADGAPYDEYEPEVEQILPRIFVLHTQGELTEENVRQVIVDVFRQMFGAGNKDEPSEVYIQRCNFPAGQIVNFFHGAPFMFGIRDCEPWLR